MMVLSASLACARQLNIEADVEQLLMSGIVNMHIDIMDGHNVPNLCLNFYVVEELKNRFPQTIIDAHLMVDAPEQYVQKCKNSGVDWMIIDPNTSDNLEQLLNEIRNIGMKPGIAINPDYCLDDFKDIMPYIDVVLIMSVVPGEKGRQFINETYSKIDKFLNYRKDNGLNYIIMIDGGIDKANGRLCLNIGADALVLGALAIFNQGVPISEACSIYMLNLKS